jgi:hypothetical protein
MPLRPLSRCWTVLDPLRTFVGCDRVPRCDVERTVADQGWMRVLRGAFVRTRLAHPASRSCAGFKGSQHFQRLGDLRKFRRRRKAFERGVEIQSARRLRARSRGKVWRGPAWRAVRNFALFWDCTMDMAVRKAPSAGVGSAGFCLRRTWPRTRWVSESGQR